MKHINSRFQQRTSSSDLTLAFGFSIIMHVLIVVVDPLVNISMDDRWKDQIQGSITVYLRDGLEEERPKGAHLTNPAAVKKVSAEARKMRTKKAAARKPAKLAKPVDKPVLASKNRKADIPPVPRVKKEVPPPEAPPLKVEPPRKSEEVPPTPPPPVEKKIPVPEPPPAAAAPQPAIEPGPQMVIKKSPVPVILDDAAEPEIEKAEPPKPRAVPIKPVDQPMDREEVQALTAIPKKGKAKEVRSEQIPRPVPEEVKEIIKTEQLPTSPVIPTPPEVSQEPPVKPEPVKIEERPVEPPVKPEPVTVEERPVEPPVQKTIEPVQAEIPPPAPVEAAPEEKREAPVIQELARADEQPVVSPKPQEALSETASPIKTEKEEVKEPLQKKSQEPPPVTAGPPAAAKDEKVKGQPIDSPVVADKTADKAVETPLKVVEPKAVAPVVRRTISLSMLKRLESDTAPMHIGIPISRPKVKITTPALKKVKNRVQKIAGQVNGNGITRVILSLNDDSVTVPVERDAFHWEGALKDGKNTITATVWDRNRYSAVDKIIVEAVPAKNSFSLSIDEPGAGEVESPVIAVKGKVGDNTVDTVRLILNKGTIEVAVQAAGGFEKTVLFRDGENSLQAEAVNATGASARSSLLNVTVKNQKTPDILVHLIWNDEDSELRATVARKNRDGLDQENIAVSDVDVMEKMSAREGYRERVFAVYGAKAGAHLISVSGGKKTKCLVIVTVPSKQKTRLFGPVLIGEDGTMIGRLLLPEGVYWDEDEWFTGKIENGDSITKYNSPEGMSWKEMK